MIHHIIVKWKNDAGDRDDLYSEVEKLFSSAGRECGVESAEVIKNCIARENRYDIMIRLHMDEKDLPVWDSSALHHEWKDTYSALIDKKAIFDCE